jgi:hypothetical protein
MTSDERIIKYLENELTSEERIIFETDVRNSSQLRKEYEKFLRVKNEIADLKEIKLNENYLGSIVPEFRNKLDLPKATSVRRNLGYAIGVMLVLIISVVILQKIFTNNSELNEVQKFTESLNANQRIELLENLSGNLEDYYQISENTTEMELINLLQTDLKINNDVAEAYDINYTELVEGLSEIEADKIYQEILNTNFSEEVKL